MAKRKSKKRGRYSEATKLELVTRLVGGETSAAIAEETGIGVDLLRRWKRELGTAVEAGTVQNTQSGERRSYTDEFKRQMVERLMGGMTVEALAAETGVSRDSLCRWSKQVGVDPKLKNGKQAKHPVDRRSLNRDRHPHIAGPSRGIVQISEPAEIDAPPLVTEEPKRVMGNATITSLEQEIDELRQEVARKDKALADIAVQIMNGKIRLHT